MTVDDTLEPEHVLLRRAIPSDLAARAKSVREAGGVPLDRDRRLSGGSITERSPRTRRPSPLRPAYGFAGLRCVLAAVSALTPLAAQTVDFDRDVRPILSDRCFHCHGPDAAARRGDLRLDLREGALASEGGRVAIVPGDIAASELIRRIRSVDATRRMPPSDSHLTLSETEITLLERWVASGAPWSQPWALVTPRSPPIPRTVGDGWSRTSIDRFVFADLVTAGLRPTREEGREKLLRRVTLDLTGLPPTLEELDAFVDDASPDAYERVLDRLFGSLAYGERMAWDWMDAARYADTNGFQGDRTRTMWPWRDWVVQAFVTNLPFDAFSIWQLAGDLLPRASDDQRLATAFLRNHMINGEGGRIPEESRVAYVCDQVETLGTLWLGMTLNCCRCHDHKFDPIPQSDYYRMFAFFDQTPVTGAGDDPFTPPTLTVTQPSDLERRREFDLRVSEAARLVAESERQNTGDVNLSDPLNAIQRASASERSPADLKALAQHVATRHPAWAAALRALADALGARDQFERSLPRVMVMADQPSLRRTHVLERGLYDQPRVEVTADTPRALPAMPPGSPRTRAELARWLFEPSHPLTARVAVNRHWQQIFGVGLVPTSDDFGTRGTPRAHPELLDHLATRFVASGWDLAALLRLMVSSATYRQSGAADGADWSRDPENRLLARGPRSRLPSWMLRDQALAASGLLRPRSGGPPVKPYQPDGIWEELTFGTIRYEQSHGDDLYRRSLYTFWRRIVGPTSFFDGSTRRECTVRVPVTNSPLHALVTFNDPLYAEASRALAQRVLESGASSARVRITQLFRLLTSRRPSAAELEILAHRLSTLLATYAQNPTEALAIVSVGESPRSPELDPSVLAAYTALSSLLLNLDETLCK